MQRVTLQPMRRVATSLRMWRINCKQACKYGTTSLIYVETFRHLTFYKTNWQPITWELRAGKLQLVQVTEERFIMEDDKGAYAVLQFLSPNEPNVGLGFRLCTDGNQDPLVWATLAAVRKLCESMAGAYLSKGETRQALWQRLVPKVIYDHPPDVLDKEHVLPLQQHN